MLRSPLPPNADRNGRSPCLPIAAAFGVGIATDHFLTFPRLNLFVAAVLMLAMLIVGRHVKRSWRVTLLLVVYGVLGAASHGAAWRDRGPASITRRLGDEPRLATLTGVAVSSPRIARRRESGRSAAWPLEDQSRLIVELDSIAAGSRAEFERVTGLVQMTSAGHLIHIAPGDRLIVTGWLSRPPRPHNPGAFDVSDYLRKHHVDATFHVDHPDAVRRLDSPSFNWRRLAAEQRARLSVLFADCLSDANGPIGAAMILGDRSAMPLDLRDAYVASGAMHILAISGLNVGIFAVFLMAIGRVLNFSPTSASGTVIACVWIYAVLTDLEPPVVRAAVFLSIWAVAKHALRQPALLNTVAATSLILMVRDPLLLFDVGAQLSFLAVLGMSWSMRVLPSTHDRLEEYLEGRPWWSRIIRPVLSAQVMGAGIWLFTAPLIAAEFGIVSPVGVLLNVVLVPLATFVMWTGYAFFGVCLLIPQAAAPFGGIFDIGLTIVNSIVMVAGNWRFGHLSVPSPPTWWLAGFYLLITIDLVRPALMGRRLRRQSFLLAWVAVGLASGFLPGKTGDSLHVTTLDVGHGGAILIEMPNGRTLLFDCGSMEDDRWVADAVWQALRNDGRTKLDVLVISHADLDHCNNVPALIRGGAVGSVVTARSFLDFDQPVVAAACDAARRGRVPIRLVEAGARLDLDPTVEVEVLHPSDGRPNGDDNANSIVLRIQYGGRTLLLTGDLEGAGQLELFARHPEVDCDVLFAPHHGGSKANTWELANWATPDAVIVSAGRRVREETLSAVYPGSRIYLTPRHGAISITFRDSGWMGIESAAHAEP